VYLDDSTTGRLLIIGAIFVLIYIDKNIRCVLSQRIHRLRVQDVHHFLNNKLVRGIYIDLYN